MIANDRRPVSLRGFGVRGGGKVEEEPALPSLPNPLPSFLIPSRHAAYRSVSIRQTLDKGLHQFQNDDDSFAVMEGVHI